MSDDPSFRLPPVNEAMMDAYTEQEHLLDAGLLDPDQPTLYTHMVENRRLMLVRYHEIALDALTSEDNDE